MLPIFHADWKCLLGILCALQYSDGFGKLKAFCNCTVWQNLKKKYQLIWLVIHAPYFTGLLLTPFTLICPYFAYQQSTGSYYQDIMGNNPESWPGIQAYIYYLPQSVLYSVLRSSHVNHLHWRLRHRCTLYNPLLCPGICWYAIQEHIKVKGINNCPVKYGARMTFQSNWYLCSDPFHGIIC